MSVKDNHYDLKTDIADYVDDEQLRTTMEQATQLEKNCERIKRRIAYVTTDIDWIHGKNKLMDLAYIGAINTTVETSN